MIETFSLIEGQFLLFLQSVARHAGLNEFFIVLTHAGMVIWPVLGIVLLITKRHRKEGIGMLLAIGIGVIITNVILKNAAARPRPYTLLNDLTPLISAPRDYSFPSGHTCMSVAAAGTLVGLSDRKWAIAGCTLAALIAFSRMYVGVHYPTDILGGAVIGALSAWIAVHIIRYAEQKKNT